MPCKKRTTEKYKKRPSPPYPSNDPGCRDKRRKGNDGTMYDSTPDSRGVYRWVKVVKAGKSKTKK